MALLGGTTSSRRQIEIWTAALESLSTDTLQMGIGHTLPESGFSP
jgi:hypothetical protein